jgi:hypothetical protein
MKTILDFMNRFTMHVNGFPATFEDVDSSYIRVEWFECNGRYDSCLIYRDEPVIVDSNGEVDLVDLENDSYRFRFTMVVPADNDWQY